MAFVNISKPSGLSPVKYLNGAKWTGQANQYAIPAADTNAYYPGDLVILGPAADPATGLLQVTLATAGNPAVGVVVAVGPGTNPVGGSGQGGGAGGPMINPNNLAVTFRPAAAQSGVWYTLIVDDPAVIFEIQEGGAGTNLTAATGHGNANIVYAAPAAGVVVSGTQLNNATVATTATLNLKIMSLAQRIDNHFVTVPATGGGAQKWWVLINNHQYRSGVLGV